MSASEIDRTLVRLAHEILERTRNLDQLAFVGIRRRGVPLAQRLAKKIRLLEKKETIVAQLAEVKSIAESRELRQIDAKAEGNDQTRVTSVAFSDGCTAGFKRITKQLEDKLVKVEAGIAELGP